MSDTTAVLTSSEGDTTARISYRPSRSTVNLGLAALVDQSVFSLGNFASTVIVGKFAGDTELGIYALAMATVYLATAFQRALVAAPYTVQVQRLTGERRSERRGSALVQVLIVTTILCLLVATLRAVGLVQLGDFRVSALLLVALTASWGLRDFWRRILFADLRFGEALALDGLVVGAQLSLLAYYTSNQLLSATTALQAVIWPSAISSLAFFLFRRRQFRISATRLSSDFRASWRYGRWSTLTEGIFAGQELAIQALLAASSSFATTGVYAACMSIVKLTNPLVYAIGNLVGPRTAQTLHQEGPRKLATGVNRVAWFVAASMAAYLVVVFVAGGLMMEMLYGSAYADKHWLLVILSLAAAFTALGMAPAKGISAMEKPQLNLIANATGFAVVIVAAWLSFPAYGVYGVATSILAGAAICCLCKWVLFRAFLVRYPRASEGV